MPILWSVLFVTGAIPLWRAWRVNGQTTLRHAMFWALASWGVWGLVLARDWIVSPADRVTWHYFAWCLTACAGVAVLGARRPGVRAWNAVVFGLLAVLYLPVARGLMEIGSASVDRAWVGFLAVTVAVGVANYLPTRTGLGAVCLALAGGLDLTAHTQVGIGGPWPAKAGAFLLALAPWAALGFARRKPATEFDRRWLAFRDRYGMVWGLRLREQFNRSAASSGWPVELGWQGLRFTGEPPPEPGQTLAVLTALMKRFGMAGPADQ